MQLGIGQELAPGLARQTIGVGILMGGGAGREVEWEGGAGGAGVEVGLEGLPEAFVGAGAFREGDGVGANPALVGTQTCRQTGQTQSRLTQAFEEDTPRTLNGRDSCWSGKRESTSIAGAVLLDRPQRQVDLRATHS